MPSRLLDLSRAFKRALDAQDERALRRLVSAYGLMWNRLSGRVDALLLEIERDSVTAGAVARLARYKSLMSAIDDEVTRYSGFLTTELNLSATDAVRLGVLHSSRLTTALLGEAGIRAELRNLPVNSIVQMLGFLQEGSPLYERIGELAGVSAQRVRDALLEGIGLGFNPRKTAASIQDAFSGGLTDALRMTRTADLYAYRGAAFANYRNNSDVVTGWVQIEELDGDTCAVCVAEHGSIHSLDEEFEGHYNCRGAAIPYIEGLSEQPSSGEEWFAAQTEDTQRGILGKGKYEGWKNGDFTLRDLVGRGEDPTYGTMVYERPLKELVAAESE